MEIRVAVPNPTHAQSLLQRLAGALEAAVSLDALGDRSYTLVGNGQIAHTG